MTGSVLTMKSVYVVGVILFAISSYAVLPTDGSNILGVFLSLSQSHLIVHMSVMKALAEKGHNITVVSSQRPRIEHKHIKTIIIEPAEEQLKQYESVIFAFTQKNASFIKKASNYYSYTQVVMDFQTNIFLDKRFTALYNNKDNKFDVAIMGYFVNDFQVAVGGKFNCPIIISWVVQPAEYVYNMVGIPEELSYVPTGDIASKPGEILNFTTRFKNLLIVKLWKIVFGVIDYAMEARYNKLAENDPLLPSFDVMKKNISLLFCNSHYSELTARPLPPAAVLIGGIQIKETPDALPKDIENFLNASKENGAILFSLGTSIKDDFIKPHTIQAFFRVLSNLKQNVIWKWNDLDNTPGNATNILYKKWVPQDDILAHPNIKLFITHAGKGGLAEAMYHGVPMVALPMFADQIGNAERLAVAGYGVVLDATSRTETEFRNAISEVLTNTSYAAEVKAFSKIYRDRPLSAQESVVYWTEYVIRHRGARFMQSPLVHMNFVQSSNLDIYSVIVVSFYVVYKLIQLVMRLIRLVFVAKCKKSKKE